MKTCGDFGGMTYEGKPCRKRSGALCAKHAKIEDEHTKLKADFRMHRPPESCKGPLVQETGTTLIEGLTANRPGS